jgi:hypothetical protein
MGNRVIGSLSKWVIELLAFIGFILEVYVANSNFNFSIRERTGFNSVIVIYTIGMSFSATCLPVSLAHPLASIA